MMAGSGYACETPEELIKINNTYTGQFLKKLL